MTAEPAPDGARLPARPEEMRAGGETGFPYPSRALGISFLTLLLFDTSIVIEVWDRDRAAPGPQEVTADEEGGRGLLIVAALSTRWGCFLPPQGGKAVWAELALPGHPVTASGLPRRAGVLVEPYRVTSLVERDPELLTRMHHGLRDL